MAIFGYGRVSTAQQDTENQRLELGKVRISRSFLPKLTR
ncbi:Uncharacterised protein [Klebsiella pneumoniae]|nr:Uncharacterised protein [Klebsiella pneumoniae]